MKSCLLLVDSGFHVGTELLHVLLYAVDSAKGYQVGNAFFAATSGFLRPKNWDSPIPLSSAAISNVKPE